MSVAGDPEYDNGDELELEFDMYTSMGGVLTTKYRHCTRLPAASTSQRALLACACRYEVDEIFGFSTILGNDYRGYWYDCLVGDQLCRSLRIVITDSGAPLPRTVT